MDLMFGASVYLVIWWTVLFAVLPLGVQSHHEAGLDVPGGGDPASPVDPRLLRKFITTTWVSAIVFALVYVCMRYHLVHLPALSGG
jgi:predicted secreted protein